MSCYQYQKTHTKVIKKRIKYGLLGIKFFFFINQYMALHVILWGIFVVEKSLCGN